MDVMLKQGRIIFGIVIAALGIEHLVCAWFKVYSSSRAPASTTITSS